jgi:hypothetical protein
MPRILRADRPRLNPEWVEETFDHVGLLALEGDAARLAAEVAELALVRVPADAAAAVVGSDAEAHLPEPEDAGAGPSGPVPAQKAT